MVRFSYMTCRVLVTIAFHKVESIYTYMMLSKIKERKKERKKDT